MGLAAYIIEKFAIWTDKKNKFLDDGGIEKKFSLEDLLDNVMIYWVTGSITTSMRLYAEAFSAAGFALGLDRLVVARLAKTSVRERKTHIIFTGYPSTSPWSAWPPRTTWCTPRNRC